MEGLQAGAARNPGLDQIGTSVATLPLLAASLTALLGGIHGLHQVQRRAGLAHRAPTLLLFTSVLLQHHILKRGERIATFLLLFAALLLLLVLVTFENNGSLHLLVLGNGGFFRGCGFRDGRIGGCGGRSSSGDIGHGLGLETFATTPI